jgi:gluconokinase
VKLPNRIVLMGVSGVGKTAVGRILAGKLKGLFVDADDLHPQANVDKMEQGIALTDDDRWPWLDRVAKVLREHEEERPLVVACSALKRIYRRRLGEDYHLVFLKGTSSDITQRLQDRDDHFMPISLLESQFEALEEPENALIQDLGQPLNEIAENIILALS